MIENEKGVKKEKKIDKHLKWIIEIFIITFILSICFSFISTNGVSKLDVVPAIFILVLVIFIGILFDIIGVSITAASPKVFHSMNARKVKGANVAVNFIKNSER